MNKVEQSPGGGGDLDLLSIVEVVVRRRWIIFFAMCIGIGVSVFPIEEEPKKTYVAEANVLITANRGLDAKGRLMGRKPFALGYLRNAEIGRRALEHKVPYTVNEGRDSIRLWDYFEEKNLQDLDKVSRDQISVRTALNRFFGHIQLIQNDDGIVRVLGELRDSLVVAAAVGALLDELIRFHTELKQEDDDKDLNFLNARLRDIEQDFRVAQDSLMTFKRTNRSRVNDLDLIDELESEYTWRQRLVDARAGLYESLLNQREQMRLGSFRNRPEFEVLSFEISEKVQPTRTNLKSDVVVGAGVGFIIGIFLAFVVDFIDRCRRAGQLDQIVRAYRGD